MNDLMQAVKDNIAVFAAGVLVGSLLTALALA